MSSKSRPWQTQWISVSPPRTSIQTTSNFFRIPDSRSGPGSDDPSSDLRYPRSWISSDLGYPRSWISPDPEYLRFWISGYPKYPDIRNIQISKISRYSDIPKSRIWDLRSGLKSINHQVEYVFQKLPLLVFEMKISSFTKAENFGGDFWLLEGVQKVLEYG